MYSLKLIDLPLILFIFITHGNTFNIDTDFPIIYFDNNLELNSENETYFGFSVILYEGEGRSKINPWIQIGAPKGEYRSYYNFHQPGLVYRCPISQPCTKPFPVDTRVNSPRGKMGKDPYVYIAQKSKAWIGATMDIDQDHQRFITCGPRWINSNREHYIQGACYWSNINDTRGTRDLLPLTNTNKEVVDNVYYYPMGQVGMSVHFPKSRNPQVVMGAPGVYNWRGTLVSYQDDAKFSSVNINRQIESMFKMLTIPDASKIKEVYSFGYLGYSISSGNFFSRNELSFVAGAPRSAMYKGQILVFDFARNSKEDITVRQTRQGMTMGEYFGAAVGVADINGDHLDDLIVGAPHYSAKYDEGRIYIFYGNRRENLLKPDLSPEITGNFSGGQFGTAIQSLGDIDDDGCADIAVGAPYEDDDHGVVYIYNGRKKGIPLKLTQRIEGKRLYFNLKGFGISFSRPTDIDNNHFNDIAVGSFLSNNAVILRMRPTVTLEMNVYSLEKRLARNSTNFTIVTCFSFSGRDLPSSLKISRTIVLDKNHRRVYQHGLPVATLEYTNETVVNQGQEECNSISIGIIKTQNSKIEWKPIEIIVSQELIEKKVEPNPILVRTEVENTDRFCKVCPVVNRLKSVREVKIDVPFALNCGSDEKCEADLKVSGKFVGLRNDRFVIGLYKTLQLEIKVENKDEPAYLASVEVTLPINVYLSAKPAECDEKNINNTVIIICPAGNPLEDKPKTITLDLDMEAITNLKQDYLRFKINAKSKSDDKNKADNSIDKDLVLVTDASIKILGKTEKSIYYFGNESLSNATHVYEVHKSGVSPLNEFILNVSIPVAYKTESEEIHFMQIHEPRGFQDRQVLTCHWPEEYIQETQVLEVEDISQNLTRTKRAIPDDSNNNNNTFDFAPIDKIVFINCSMPEVVCKTIMCTVGPFRQMLKGASLQIKMVMNMTQIKKHVLGDKTNIYLSTDGIVQEIEGPVFRKDQIRVSTAFVKESEEQKVDYWIIILAVVCGILILLLIVLGLVKAGFFKRKHKDELEALKQAEDKSNPKEPTNLCFLDWQLSHVGPPVLDLLYFIYACTDKKLRDEHFDQLLKDYYQTLKEYTKELGTDLEKHYSYEILLDQMKKFGRYGLAIGIMLLHLLLSDSEEIPDINEIFEEGDADKMMEAFSFESKNADVYNTRMRDVIKHVVEKGYI